ncbi:MAG: UDP-N-acetylglucosamine 2-epimerase [Bacteroidota bacterium]
MGASGKMNILVLTSSRADFGIYMPLLHELKTDESVNLKILVFGTHLSKFHGYTITDIRNNDFEVDFTISTILAGDESVDISTSYALTAQKFSDFWNLHQEDFDWVVALGDRFEMAAAVAAGIPFNLRFAHIHGGETTLGAIDNIYRHSITLASKLHFVAHPEFKKRVCQILNEEKCPCHVVGALSLDNIVKVRLLSTEEFEQKWAINLNMSSILVTLHPETVSVAENEYFVNEAFKALGALGRDTQLIITMPNADTSGTMFRTMYQKLKDSSNLNIKLIENFGTQSYFTCMKYSSLMIGNTSSGIIEAASFGKFVINVGDRQKGRLSGENVIDVHFESDAIIELANKYKERIYDGPNVYFQNGAASKIVKKLKETNV